MGWRSVQSYSEYGSMEKEAKLGGMVGPGKSNGTSTSTTSCTEVEEEEADGVAEAWKKQRKHVSAVKRMVSGWVCEGWVEVGEARRRSGAVIARRLGWALQRTKARESAGEVESVQRLTMVVVMSVEGLSVTRAPCSATELAELKVSV